MTEIKYKIVNATGSETVSGEAVGVNSLAIRWETDDRWVIDHVPTGLRVISLRDEKSAKIVAESILGALDWSTYKPDDKDKNFPSELTKYLQEVSYKKRIWPFGGEPISAPKVIINLHIEADIDFPVEDLWPDGDYPDEITESAVRDLIQDAGGIEKVIDDWNLSSWLHCDVDIRPKKGE